jgi:hypothetical protein
MGFIMSNNNTAARALFTEFVTSYGDATTSTYSEGAGSFTFHGDGTPVVPFDDGVTWAHTIGLLDERREAFSTYTDGEVVRYTFNAEGEAAEAARLFAMSPAEYVDEVDPEVLADGYAAAVVQWCSDYAVPLDEDGVRAAREAYQGEHESNAKYAESVADALGVPDYLGEWVPKHLRGIVPLSIDFDDMALILDNTEGYSYFSHGGHYFAAAN